MEYQKIKEKTVKLNGREVFIEEIREIEGLSSNTYEINNSQTYSSQAIFGAILEVEAREKSGENLNFFQKLLQVFGLFVFQIHFMNEFRFGMPMGFRKFGYHKCSFFVELMFGRRAFVMELVFADKNVYKDGIFPAENVNLKRLI